MTGSTKHDTVITYVVRDFTGGIRGAGIKTQEAAEALADKVCEESIMPITCEIERVTYNASTLREVIGLRAKVDVE